MTLLLASIVALAVGPLLYRLAWARGQALALIDGFIFVSMGGMIGQYLAIHQARGVPGYSRFVRLFERLCGNPCTRHDTGAV